ncbi:MAG TPA: hypothetical protein VGB63_10505 [Pedobacter sp.]|jgi:hypothetical protein
MHLFHFYIGQEAFTPERIVGPAGMEGWAERKASREFCLRAEASFFLGRFGPFAAMPKGLGPPAAISGKDILGFLHLPR